jgi:quercetin dioxygenase-like cupin family protein
MTSLAAAKDLTVVQPRGLDAELDGYAWLPRMLDKARASLAGTNGSYLFGCPVDHTCMARLGVSPELVLELAGRYPEDTDVLRAMRERGIPPAREAWFDGQAVEDELQDRGWYLRVRPGKPATGGAAIELAPGRNGPSAVSDTGEIVTVTDGEVTFFLGKHQARTVHSGETVWIPAGVEWRFHNPGGTAASMMRVSQS